MPDYGGVAPSSRLARPQNRGTRCLYLAYGSPYRSSNHGSSLNGVAAYTRMSNEPVMSAKNEFVKIIVAI